MSYSEVQRNYLLGEATIFMRHLENREDRKARVYARSMAASCDAYAEKPKETKADLIKKAKLSAKCARSYANRQAPEPLYGHTIQSLEFIIEAMESDE